MEISYARLIGVLGLILAIIEIWQPRISVLLENLISKHIVEVEGFQDLYNKELKIMLKVAQGSRKEVLKGPSPVSYDEFKANVFTSITCIRYVLLFYVITVINFLILKPVRLILMYLNKFGNGRAVGGLGLALAVIGIFL